jgi:hypothetical protein
MECPDGDNCNSCHNSVELNYHQNNYKNRFCIFYPDNLRKCKFGEYCSYAHSENDILIELLHNMEYDQDFFMFHFKTAFCCINHIEHDRSMCVYAHNWQDYRRKPQNHFIEQEMCPDWNSGGIVLDYSDGCPRGMDCSYSHGWKEPEYHPFFYKTQKCEYSQEKCPRLAACPFYHDFGDMRTISKEDE